MLQIISGSTANKLLSINESSINRVDSDKRIVEADIVGIKSEIRFLIPETMLNFAELRQAFEIALILHYFDSEYHIHI